MYSHHWRASFFTLVRMFVTTRSFGCLWLCACFLMVLVFDRASSSAFILMFVGAFIRTKNNHTVSRVFIWVGHLGVWVSCSRNTNVCNNTFLACRLIITRACFVMVLVYDRASSTLILLFVAAFLERGTFTHFLRLFIYVRLITSVPACFVMVLVCDRTSSTLIRLFVGAFLERGILGLLWDLKSP